MFDAVTEWPVPKSITEIRQFIGLGNFYRGFVQIYANIAQPITDLLQKIKFEWRLEQDKAFRRLKTALSTTPVLVDPSSSKQFSVSKDAYKHAVGATLEQDGHPVACIDWDTGYKEPVAFMLALRKWNVYLRGRLHFQN